MDIRKQLIILILVLLCAPVSAQKKEKLITLKFTNIPLSEAMPKVEKQSGYTFFYESQQIDIKQKVSLNVKNDLNSAALQFNFLFKFLGNKILPRILPCQIFHLP